MKRYAAIIADPPWEYEHPRVLLGNGGRGAVGASKIVQVDVSAHYETIPLEDLKALDIPAAENCLLFLWTTNGFLSDGRASAVVRAWGFKPMTVLTWAKVRGDGRTPSMTAGHWFRSASEQVIFAIKGRVPRPPGLPALPSWFPANRLPHSVKPDHIHQYAEMCCRDGPWLEMFARRPRPGWDLWGNEAPGARHLKVCGTD